MNTLRKSGLMAAALLAAFPGGMEFMEKTSSPIKAVEPFTQQDQDRLDRAEAKRQRKAARRAADAQGNV